MEEQLEGFYRYVRPALLQSAEDVHIDTALVAEHLLATCGKQALIGEEKELSETIQPEKIDAETYASVAEFKEQRAKIAALLRQTSRQSMSIAELAQWAIQQPVSDDAKTDLLHYAATLLPKLQEEGIQKIPANRRVVYLAFARHELIRELLNLR